MALNHVRVPDDLKMARENSCPETLDMVFGGHDHHYFRTLAEETDVFVQKSGSDFEDFTNLIVLFDVKEEDYLAYTEKVKAEAVQMKHEMTDTAGV